MGGYPINEIVPELKQRLRSCPNVVLSAPTASGKTTVLPLALLEEPWLAGRKIIILEPRRLACFAAARRLAMQLGEVPGSRVGYRTRLDSKSGSRIEVVTEGILTRMIQHDPELNGVGLVIFDEFHERNLHADVGLALLLEAQAAWREDLRILVMSATLDTAAVARLLGDAPVVTGKGRGFPVEITYQAFERERPLADMVCDMVRYAAANEEGSILVFLPGEAEIGRCCERLKDIDALLFPLYGRLSAAEQQQAIEPAPPGRRKIVLATNLAESSLTIDGVRIVIDSGWERRAFYHPGTGMSHLRTVPIAAANAEQRAGRAGRNEPGICHRLWTKMQHERREPEAPPEILLADLTGMALELAVWGVADPKQLRWLTPPPDAAFLRARRTLLDLGAIENDGKVTDHGKKLHATGLHPRIAELIWAGMRAGAGLTACRLAAFLSENTRNGVPGCDLNAALAEADKGKAGVLARQLAGRFHITGDKGTCDAAEVAASAWFDRIARRRSAQPGEKRYQLTGGRGAFFRDATPLTQYEYLVIPELSGGEAESEIRLAAGLSAAWVEKHCAARMHETAALAVTDGKFRWRRRKYLGAIVIAETPVGAPSPAEVQTAVVQYVREQGLAVLPWDALSERLLARLRFVRRTAPELWPDVSEAGLLETLDGWLAPFIRNAADPLRDMPLAAALASLLDYARKSELDRVAPERFTTPAGTHPAIDYTGAVPAVAVKLPELYGLAKHPQAGMPPVPLQLHLLSPAGRPVQITTDLPGFWRGSYALVRAEMRARYPKHHWPEDPAAATPKTTSLKKHLQA